MAKRIVHIGILISLLNGLTGCIGTVIETTTDAAIGITKVPFKVGGAAVDIVTDDDKKEE